jgi:hypothetical protein
MFKGPGDRGKLEAARLLFEGVVGRFNESKVSESSSRVYYFLF